ncbi:Ferritin-like domain-containing protein [Sphingomonas gellani]|uniref:Ferritin-like domain-containing protein n=1 Tax=Sphingomonas gellani TaxID=1166340 RepID=A0A1H8HM74_9SPHN|nr:ferritin-like domain-containing protein [Sphingomonas gellani]SEN57035.1 Ferritin-like domain-containing protein [Sphingomonas gellani]
MTDSATTLDALDARVRRREGRRDFFRAAIGGAAVAAAGATALGMASGAAAQAVTLTDADILNFALNLEYLEAQFYSYAVTGAGLPSTLLGGTGTPGAVTGGKQVAFTDPVVAQYAREIAADEQAHVQFLRTQLGSSAVAQPAIDLGFTASSAFSKAAQAAGLVTAGTAFDAYASDENFLLAAFLFEDVGVTAYKGASPLISSNTYIDAAAGILAAEAFHAGLIRQTLYAKGIAAPSLLTSADKISDARDTLDGAQDLDQGISTKQVAATATTPAIDYSNIAPTDLYGRAYSRSAGQVLGIVYLNATAGTTSGGFFPAGVNGTIKTSSAS